MKIYFDNELINEDAYMNIDYSHKLFGNSFILGSVSSRDVNITINKMYVMNIPNKVILKEDNIDFAHLYIDKIEDVDDNSCTYSLTDALVKANFNYDASNIFINGKTTLLEIAKDICNKIGIELGSTNFRGYNKEITWYNNNKTARQYLGYIAELNSGYAYIGSDNKLYFMKYHNQSKKDISLDVCEDFKVGTKHKITRVVFELGTLKYEYGDDIGDTLYLNSENVFITEESEVQAIYDDIKNFEFYNFKTSNYPIDISVKVGELITFTDGINNYPTICNYDLSYNIGWIGGQELSIDSKKIKETKNIGMLQSLKDISIIVDRDSNLIKQTIIKQENINNDLYGVDDYKLTNDTTFQDNKNYYKYDETLDEYIMLIKDVDYVINDSINENIYEYSYEEGLEQKIKQVETKLTEQDFKIDIVSTNINMENGNIERVEIENSYLFDKNGLKMGNSETDFNALHNNVGTYYKDGDTVLSQTTKDGTITRDLVLYGKYYYGVDEDLDVANFKKDDAMFVAEKYVDSNGEEGFGHFYNGGE